MRCRPRVLKPTRRPKRSAIWSTACASVIVPESQGSKLDPSTRDGVGTKMGLDATVPFDAPPGKFQRISIPGEHTLDVAALTDARPATDWRRAR